MLSRLRFFRRLISIGRWQPRDLSWKAAVMMEEEGGSNNVSCGCAATSWLQVVLVAARAWRNKRKTGQRCTRLLQRRAAAVWSKRPLLLQRKIAAGNFFPQGSLLAEIKEDGSERSLLAVKG
ncbi:hypothetical protein BHM03_00047233 [Ensete ventricosum]|nr:hypothetical protein BHM03_00047233 [Ensete ventricosum]